MGLRLLKHNLVTHIKFTIAISGPSHLEALFFKYIILW